MGAALAATDEAVLLPVRDVVATPTAVVSGVGIGHAAVAAGVRIQEVGGLVQVIAAVAALARPGDVVLTMGVGEVAGLGALILAPAARPLTVV